MSVMRQTTCQRAIRRPHSNAVLEKYKPARMLADAYYNGDNQNDDELRMDELGMTRWFFLLLALLIGMFLPIQQGVNSTLTRSLSSPLQGALASFAIGTIALLVICVVLRLQMPSLEKLAAAPWWAWTGGLMGAAFITIGIVLAPKIGATATASAIIAGQILASLLIDHHGLLGFTQHPVNVGRAVGVILLLTGVVLIRRF